jgi:hypothetical protein
LDRSAKLLVPDRLLDAAVGSQLITLCQLPWIARGSQDDDRSQSGPGVSTHPTQDINAVKLRKLQVEEDQSGERGAEPEAESAPPEEEIQRLLSIAGDFDLACGIELSEWAQRELDLERAVLHQQDVGGR